jgi:hypothetical protein
LAFTGRKGQYVSAQVVAKNQNMTQNFTIYHNPRCKKSREALNLLRENNIEP